jgi:hypothetical protein
MYASRAYNPHSAQQHGGGGGYSVVGNIPPCLQETRRAGKITTIMSFRCANLTVYIYRDNNKCLFDLLSKILLCN